MKTQFNTAWQIERPLRAFTRGFVALSLLVCISTPFMSDLPSPWPFLFGGIGYSAFLSFFAVGICLLPLRLRTRVLAGMLIFQTVVLVGTFAMLLLALPDSAPIIHAALSLCPWIFGVVGAYLLALASYGWYVRLTKDSTCVA